MFIQPVPEEQAPPAVADMYHADRHLWGFLPNFTQAFSHHPEAYAAWGQLIGSIRGSMDLRRCELATLAAARVLRTTYCSVAHAKILRDRFYDADAVARIAGDHHAAGLDDVDVAVMDFAEKVAADPTAVTPEDVDGLRNCGLDDRDVLDVVLAVAARCFFATVIEALGAQADEELTDPLEDHLLQQVVVGRPPADPRRTADTTS